MVKHDNDNGAPALAGAPKLKVLDLFSGIGGFSLGLERTGGFDTAAFCEISTFPRQVLAKNWPEVPCYDDVRNLTAERLSADGVGPIDVITGGFPCQDLSIAGRRAGIEAERSGLWSEIVRLVGELRPRYLIVENVANLLSGPSERRGAWFGRVLGDLAELGYDAEWENIPASAVGAPHRRERVWLVAYPNEVGRIGSCRSAAKEVVLPTEWLTAKGKRERGDVVGWVGEIIPSSVRAATSCGLLGNDDGVPDRLDRIAACGNSVVPQIPEAIGRAILRVEAALALVANTNTVTATRAA